jgi:hypothetical protein
MARRYDWHAYDASMRNLQKAYARRKKLGADPQPWRSKEESLMISLFPDRMFPREGSDSPKVGSEEGEMTKAPIPCCSKFVFVIFRFPGLFTCQGLLVLQFGTVKTGGWGAVWNGTGEVPFTLVLQGLASPLTSPQW